MRSLLSLLLLAVFARAQSPEERTKQALDLVLARKYDAFYAHFSPEMKKAISLAEYSSQGDRILEALGKPVKIGTPRSQQMKEATTVTIPLEGSGVALNFIVSWNASQQIQGTWFLAPPPASHSQYEPASYSKPDTFAARDVTVGDDQWKLPGTLLVPKGKGPFPAVVLVHGSGPHDRDETLGGAKVFRDLAEGLATRGIAVLRYDKRNYVHRQECISDKNFTMTRETVDDAVRAAALLRALPEVDAKRIFVLGHSQGGYMMPRIMQADPKLAGVVLMAANVRPVEQLIVEQTEYLFRLNGGGLNSTQQAQLDALKKDPWQMIPGIPESYRTDLKGYDPVNLAKSSRIPMLILQGERDYQVTMKDFDLWRTGLSRRANVTVHSFPKLNHLFIAGEGKSTPREYERPAHVSAEVIDTITDWILRQAPANGGRP